MLIQQEGLGVKAQLVWLEVDFGVGLAISTKSLMVMFGPYLFTILWRDSD